MLQCDAGDNYNDSASHAHMLQADAIQGPGGIRHTTAVHQDASRKGAQAEGGKGNMVCHTPAAATGTGTVARS